jgi:amino acid permease
MAYALILFIAFANQWPMRRLLRWVATVAVISVLLLLALVGADKAAGVSRILLIIVLGVGSIVLYTFRWPDSS